MLFEFIETHRAEVIARALSLEPARQWPVASEEMAHGLPRFLTQVTDALRTADEPSKPGDPAIASSATLHAGELLAQGFTVSQLVHYYGNVCQSVTGLAGEHQCQISAYEFHILNRCLDTAIAESVTEFARVRELSVTHLQSERIGQVVHELRNKLHTAMLSFHVLKTGTVGISGSTGAVLGRSLQGLRDLVDGMIAEVRLVGAAPRHDRVRLKPFIEELAISAGLHAEYRDIQLTVEPVDPALEVEVDVPLLASALSNLLQNAFKYTRERGTVSLRTLGAAGRVVFQVEDECGGMPAPVGDDPLRAGVAPRGDGRSGLGLGLSISRRATEAIGGQIRTRNLPGRGCIFEVELPLAAPAP